MFQKQKKGTTYNRGDLRYLHKKSVNPINYPRIKLYHWSIYTHIAHTYLHIHMPYRNIHIYISKADSYDVSGIFTWRIKLSAIQITGCHYLEAFIKYLTPYHMHTHHSAENKMHTISLCTLEDPVEHSINHAVLTRNLALPNFLSVHLRLIHKRSCPFTDPTNHRENLLNSNWQVISTFQ